MVAPSKENWVLVSDTKTGRSWECINRQQYLETLEFNREDLPKGFEGCYEMSVPSKVQRMVSYESNTL